MTGTTEELCAALIELMDYTKQIEYFVYDPNDTGEHDTMRRARIAVENAKKVLDRDCEADIITGGECV